ncbi:LPS export ABC transporter periplasmic protein LptC [Gaoshiqia sp. Z1-71]|uniref:LPS export ABC transporter periplasmic protein LptC n=1 Tax=Gaoshiqia hydrogeniformans TaxID=3290090 RepID=UPI003BF77DAE
MQSNRLKKPRYSHVSIAILLTGIAMLFFSCANKIEKIKEFSAGDKLPTMDAEQFEMIYSDSTIVRFKLITPKLLRYDQEKVPFTEFPEGIEIEKFNEKMKVVSVITSDYALYYTREKKWIAKNNVVAINQDGDSLKTEELIWEEAKGKFYSEQFVKIIRTDQIITGIGFESDQDMSNWEIKKVKGTLYLDVAE